jgi:hypothetical protein
VIEQAVEGGADLPEGGGLGLGHDPVVPLDAGQEGRLAEVRAADEGDARAVFALEDVGLRVEAEGAGGPGCSGPEGWAASKTRIWRWPSRSRRRMRASGSLMPR